MPRDRVGHLWVLHAKSVPRNGLWERRDLELITGRPGSPLPCRALETRLDHRPLVGEREQLGRNFDAECLRGGQIYDPFVFGPNFDRQVAGLFALENPADVDTGAAISIRLTRSVADQAANLSVLA